MEGTSALQRAAVAAARQARQELGWGTEAPFTDVLALVEGPGGVPVTIAGLPAGLSGALLVERGQPFVLINGADHPVRQRFTLAHEYGHFRLGHGEIVDGPEALTSRATHPDEVQANYFAAEFLAPGQAVTAWMEARGAPAPTLEVVVELAVAFGISAKAARIRLDVTRHIRTSKQRHELDGLIQDGEHRKLMFRLGLRELQDGLVDAQDHLPRLPLRLRQNAITGFEAGALDVERLARLLRQDPEHTERDLAEHGVVSAASDEEPDW